MAVDSVIRVQLSATTLDELRVLIDEIQPDLGCRPAAIRTSSGFTTDVFISESRLVAAQNARSATDVTITVIENITQTGLLRQADVGQGDRFAVRGVVPRGLGRKE